MTLKALFYDDEAEDRDYFPPIFKDAWKKVYQSEIDIEVVDTPEAAIERLEIRGYQFQLAILDLLQKGHQDETRELQRPRGLLVADKARELQLHIGLIALTSAQTYIKERDFESEWREVAETAQPGDYGTHGQAFLDKTRFRQPPLMAAENLADLMARVLEDAGALMSVEIGKHVFWIQEQDSSISPENIEIGLRAPFPHLETFRSVPASTWLSHPLPDTLQGNVEDFSVAFLLLSDEPSPGFFVALGWCLALFGYKDVYLLSEHQVGEDNTYNGYLVHMLPDHPEDFATFFSDLLLQ